jgi:hypothetical protein
MEAAWRQGANPLLTARRSRCALGSGAGAAALVSILRPTGRPAPGARRVIIRAEKVAASEEGSAHSNRRPAPAKTLTPAEQAAEGADQHASAVPSSHAHSAADNPGNTQDLAERLDGIAAKCACMRASCRPPSAHALSPLGTRTPGAACAACAACTSCRGHV